MKTLHQRIETIERKRQTLGRFLRLFLEERGWVECLSRRELVNLIMNKLGVSEATAYDYANALKILAFAKRPRDGLDQPLSKALELDAELEAALKEVEAIMRVPEEVLEAETEIEIEEMIAKNLQYGGVEEKDAKTAAKWLIGVVQYTRWFQFVRMEMARVRQLRAIHKMSTPPLIANMKKYGLGLWKDVILSGIPFPCERWVFADALAHLIEKVGNVARFDPDYAHNPKALAEACFIKTVEKVNHKMEVRGVNPPDDAIRYVEWVLNHKAKRGKRSRTEKKKEPTSGIRVEVFYNPSKDIKKRFLKGLDMWFVRPGEPLANAVIDYCYNNEVHWQTAVRNFLSRGLKEEGYL